MANEQSGGAESMGQMREQIRTLQRDTERHDGRLSRNEEALARLYYVPDQIKEVKDLIEDLGKRFDARGELASQNSRVSFWTVIGMAFTAMLFLLSVIVTLVPRLVK